MTSRKPGWPRANPMPMNGLRRWARWLVLTALLPPVSVRASEPAVTRRQGSLAFSPCTLSQPLMPMAVEAQCTTLQVPENHAQPHGRLISLSIAWLPAKSDSAPDPVFFIAGGPGQSARDSFVPLLGHFRELRAKHDVLLVDQRGTGASNKLSCKPDGGEDLPEDDVDAGIALIREATARCAQRLSARSDVRYYATSDAVDDLDDVRRAFGAARVNLMGVSYGTRVAQQYAKKYPAQTRTVTLDGVVPNTLVLGSTHARNLENALDLQFAQCTKVPGCSALGDPRSRLDALLALLRKSPPLVHYRDAITGESKDERLTADHVAALARMYSYQPLLAGLLPLELHEASQGRFEPLMALSKMLRETLGDSMASGMELSVICTEDQNELKENPEDANTLLGNDLITFAKAGCSVWPHFEQPKGFREPLTGSVPTLLMSGEYDPVTPPKYGDEVAKALPNSKHFTVRGQGHNVIGMGCMPRLFAKFIEGADAKSLDGSCLLKVPFAAPFLGFYGWAP